MTRRFMLVALAMSTGCGSPSPIDVGSREPIFGTWEGYIENFQVKSGSDAVRLAITSATSTQIFGKVTLGTAPPPPPPTNPAIGYPPIYSEMRLPGGDYRKLEMVEGFPMTVVDGTSMSERVTFGADWEELWHAWCVLQRPVCLAEEDVCGCMVGPGGGGPDVCFTYIDDRKVDVDCARFSLCMFGACTCDKTTCRVELSFSLDFDLRVVGDQASGSLQYNANGNRGLHNVYLTRK